MISLFERELMRMEQEVRDLKTIHQRGLGTTRLYTYERNIEITDDYAWFYFVATVENTNLLPMALMPFVAGQATTNYIIEFSDDEFRLGGVGERGTVTVRVLASQPLINITTWSEPWE